MDIFSNSRKHIVSFSILIYIEVNMILIYIVIDGNLGMISL